VDVRVWLRVLTEPTDPMSIGVEALEPLGVTANSEHPFRVQRVRTPPLDSEALQSDAALMAYVSRELHQVCVCVRAALVYVDTVCARQRSCMMTFSSPSSVCTCTICTPRR
jgi:hypothetical protein